MKEKEQQQIPPLRCGMTTKERATAMQKQIRGSFTPFRMTAFRMIR
jgi:hypothetical protein